jgi:hypothetical protein
MFINILLAMMLTASAQFAATPPQAQPNRGECASGLGRAEDSNGGAAEYLCFCTGEYVTSPSECECAPPADDGL